MIHRASHRIELNPAPSVSIIVIIIRDERQLIDRRARIDAQQRVEVAPHRIDGGLPAGGCYPGPPNRGPTKVARNERLTWELLGSANMAAGGVTTRACQRIGFGKAFC